ncbi:MAG: GNAT family N-acetyltransferase [Pseudomonadales bacterium]|nr:GNAT family N-acetyltransferase [Pseudomonadales bacterium]
MEYPGDNLTVHLGKRFAELPAALRQALDQPQRNPFFCSAFLGALEASGCVSAAEGWEPHHLWIEQGGEPVFFLPLYRKSHSWGEFVFDQSWANAYHRYGMAYYPKLVTAIPFTPSLGPRWWVTPGADHAALWDLACTQVMAQLDAGKASSWHLLFAREPLPGPQSEAMMRQDTQFHWQNRNYRSFDDFLAQMKSRKRKSIRRERTKVAEQGVTLRRRLGTELNETDWDAFYACYCNTYYERGMPPYLTREFFRLLAESMPQWILMVQACRDDRVIASAICLFDQERLYGRHWGAMQAVDCLHFEACFYQGIEFCIERGLQSFDPGTQGEHKLLRGFEPVTTRSWHWIAHSAFRQAIADFVAAEAAHAERYQTQAANYLPYRAEADL